MALLALEPIWEQCAAALELPITRGGDAYVHFDGRTLHIADDRALDDDDSLAQLVLHEICHLLVQGPSNRATRDWGLDNTGASESAFDEVRERAAVRLQAHLAGAFGLRDYFFPTTVVRPFYEALPAHPLDAVDEDVPLARAAATRAGRAPFRGALAAALRASAASLGVALHGSGAPFGEARCGDCAWRDGQGACNAADAWLVVDEEARGCTRHEPALDCLTCGACCRSGYDAVPAAADDRVVLRHPALVVARDDAFDLRRAPVGDEDRCVALDGPLAGPYACTVYADRPSACADLPVGADACLTARRRVGLSPA